MTKVVINRSRVKGVEGFEYQCPSCRGCPRSQFTLTSNELDTRVIIDENGDKKKIYLCPYFSQLE